MPKITNNVGYKSPPVSHRWKKGQSGNPSGKKKVQKVAPQPLLAIFTEQLQKPVELNQSGQISSVPLLTALVMKVLHELMAALFPQKMGGIAALAKIGVFKDHQISLEDAAAEGEPGEALISEAELRILKMISSGEFND